MSIKAIIATQFDATGIKKATKEFNKLGGSIKGALGAVGIGLGLAAVTSQLKESAKAAVEDVKSQALLAQQLRNTVGATDQAIAGSESFIKTLMIQSSIADEVLRPALATLTRATGDVGQAQSLLALSTDIAAGTGKDLGAVSIAVGKAVNGQTTSLKKLGIVIKDGQDPVAVLTKQFGGMAAAAANNDPFQRINVIMGELQETIGMALLPTLNQFANWFASTEGQAKIQEFANFIIGLIDGLVAFAHWIGENIDWLSQLAIGLAATAVAVGIFNLALNVNPIMLAVTAIGLLVTGILALNKALGISSSGVPTAVNGAAVKAGQLAYDKALRNPANYEQTSTGPKLKTGAAMSAEKARTDAYNKAIDDYKKSIKEVDKVATTPTLSYSPFVPSTTKTGSKTKSAATVALEKAQKALESFKTSLKGMGDFSSLTQMSKDVGEFEQLVTDSFDQIYKKIAEIPSNTKGLDKLKTFLNAQKDLLLANAKQRDAIIAKRSLAQALIDDVKSTLMGTGSLASLLDTQSKQVATSITKIVDGFTVTTKQTVDEVIGAKGVLGRLKDVVAKTKVFAGQLSDLKKAGLTPDLFKQIVDAGPDVGGQLATEILSGGADSVKALNDTFAELQTVGASVAEQTAVVMYNGGVDVAGGLVAGLLSQEQALVDAAKTLADAFNAAYQANIMALEVPSAPTVAPKTPAKAVTNNVKVTVKASPVNTKATGQAVYNSLSKYTQANLTSGGVLLRGGR